jgi:hypothetical protein
MPFVDTRSMVDRRECIMVNLGDDRVAAVPTWPIRVLQPYCTSRSECDLP